MTRNNYDSSGSSGGDLANPDNTSDYFPGNIQSRKTALNVT